MKRTMIILCIFLFASLAFPQETKQDLKLDNTKSKSGYLTIQSGFFIDSIYGLWIHDFIGGITFEKYTSQIFSWDINLKFLVGDNIGPYISSDIYIHPFGKKTFDPHIGLGIAYIYKAIDFPATLGFNIWLSQNIGLKFQCKTYLASIQDKLLEINLGVLVGLF